MQAIMDVGGDLVAYDPTVGIIDSHFPQAEYFTVRAVRAPRRQTPRAGATAYRDLLAQHLHDLTSASLCRPAPMRLRKPLVLSPASR
jgi:hypothetical protein